MKVDMIDKQVKNSNDPFVVFHVNLLNSIEEIESLTNNLENVLDIEEVVFLNSKIKAAELSKNEDYMIINQLSIEQFCQIMIKGGFKIKMVEYVDQIWNFNNEELNQFISLFDGEDPCPELTEEAFGEEEKTIDVLKTIMASKFTTDDVLDKISNSGIDSLNDLNKFILD